MDIALRSVFSPMRKTAVRYVQNGQPWSDRRPLTFITSAGTRDGYNRHHVHGRIRRRAEALGPWFHNIDLNGVWTAPEHFLGNYPAVKWKRFAQSLPQDLSGRSVLDIGCNGDSTRSR